MMTSLLFLALFLMTSFSAQGLSEYDLKKKLLLRYIKTVRPVAKHSDTVQVKFDIALRTVVDLEEKKQILSTSVWIRIYWTDANLKWNQGNYSNISTVNFSPDDIWTPDVVLYNSADSNGGGILQKAMATNIIVNSEGSTSWFCPLILSTECNVDIKWFPFDKQICPFRFGLWTYDGLRVNFTLLKPKADVSSYIPSGEWNFESMNGHRKELKYSCCPNTPYPVIDYSLVIIRRTRFYLLNLIWPGILIAVLAAVTFVLPPECGERIGLGITNLLAMTVFLLLISESIPPTSDAVPLAGQFFTVIMVLSAVALLESCIVIKFIHYSDSGTEKVPKFIRRFVNVYLARILCMGSVKKDNESFDLKHKSNGIDNQAMNGNTRENIAMERRENPNTVPHGKAGNYRPSEPNQADKELASGMQEIVSMIKKQECEDDYKSEWRRAVQVVDRLSTFVFFAVLIGACAGLFATAPRFYVK